MNMSLYWIDWEEINIFIRIYVNVSLNCEFGWNKFFFQRNKMEEIDPNFWDDCKVLKGTDFPISSFGSIALIGKMRAGKTY